MIRFRLIYLLIILGISSCKKDIHEDKVEENLFFKATTDEFGNIKIQKDFVYKVLVKKDSIKIYRKNSLVNSFVYKTDSKGIYIRKKDNYKLLYPFELNVYLDRDEDLTNKFYKNVILEGKKIYFLKDKKVTLYHFIENGFDGSLDSYFMEGEGFICFYKYNDDDFFYLNSSKALEVSKAFLNDSTFFAKLKLEKIDKEWEKSNNPAAQSL